MKEQLELHISWEGEGISLKSLSNILKGFDDINDTLSNNKEERAFVKEVNSGSINIVLASLAMGTLKTAPEIYYFFRNLSNKTFQKDYKKETLELAYTFIINCIESCITLTLTPLDSDEGKLIIGFEALEGIKSFINISKNEHN